MAEAVAIDCPLVAEPVSASALAQHLDCSRTYIGKLEGEGVIQRQGDGFPLDQNRVAYLSGASGSNRRAVRLTPHKSRPRPRCCEKRELSAARGCERAAR